MTRIARRGVKSVAASPTSSRRATSSAAAVPACSAISKALRSSPSSSAYSQPASHGTSVTWPEEEIGSSSAGPCSAPRARAWRRLGVLRPATAAARAPPAQPQVDDPGDDHRGDRVVDVVQPVLPAPPVLAALLAGRGETEDPGHAAEEGQHAEAHEGPPRAARRQRDERPHD